MVVIILGKVALPSSEKMFIGNDISFICACDTISVVLISSELSAGVSR